jgi:prophage regulatory protein
MSDQFLRAAEVRRLTGVKRSTQYEWIAQGKFPKPIRLSPRLVVWSAEEIEAWQRDRIAERDGGRHG